MFAHSAPTAKTGTTAFLGLACSLALLSPAVLLAAPPPPDSGALLQQNQAPKPAQPSGSDTGLKMQAPPGSALPDSAPFMITSIEISGNTLFDTPTLHALVGDLEGQEHTLGQLNAAVDRISDFYHAHGYTLARAYVPAQTLKDGLVKIFVIEARYGEIRLNNSSLVNDGTVNAILSALHAQDFVEQSRLDRTLLLLSDVPGLTSGATLQPGQQVGTSDLLVETRATAAVDSNVTADNYGNAYTGRTRLSGTLNWTDPLHMGDVLSANVLSSGQDMASASLTYETLVSGDGARIGGTASYLHYRLGGALAALNGHGVAETASLWGKYPWLRSVDANVTTQLQLDYKDLNDDIDSSDIQNRRHIDSTSWLMSGDARDNLLGGAQTTWSLQLTAGEHYFDNAAAKALDARTADTNGGFVKFNANYNRLQFFTEATALYVALSTQWANANLDSAEKMVAGGAYTVRAYGMGALSGDLGILGTLELRQNLGAWWDGHWQGIMFADSQHVQINQTPWASGTNGATLIGAGLGLSWANNSGWHVKVYGAAPVGSVPELIKEKKSTLAWAEIGAWF